MHSLPRIVSALSVALVATNTGCGDNGNDDGGFRGHQTCRRGSQTPPAAQSLYGDAIDMQIRMLGSRHPTVASSMVGLANVKLALGEPSEAQELHLRALEIMEETYAEDHPEFASVLLDLAAVLTAQRRADQALSLAERVVKIRERASMSGKLLGDAYLALARALWEAGQDYQRATRIAEQARRLYSEGQGEECQIRLAEVEEWLATHKVEM